MAKDLTTISIEIRDFPLFKRLLPALAAWIEALAERDHLSPEEEALMGAALALADPPEAAPEEAGPAREDQGAFACLPRHLVEAYREAKAGDRTGAMLAAAQEIAEAALDDVS